MNVHFQACTRAKAKFGRARLIPCPERKIPEWPCGVPRRIEQIVRAKWFPARIRLPEVFVRSVDTLRLPMGKIRRNCAPERPSAQLSLVARKELSTARRIKILRRAQSHLHVGLSNLKFVMLPSLPQDDGAPAVPLASSLRGKRRIHRPLARGDARRLLYDASTASAGRSSAKWGPCLHSFGGYTRELRVRKAFV